VHHNLRGYEDESKFVGVAGISDNQNAISDIKKLVDGQPRQVSIMFSSKNAIKMFLKKMSAIQNIIDDDIFTLKTHKYAMEDNSATVGTQFMFQVCCSNAEQEIIDTIRKIFCQQFILEKGTWVANFLS